MADLGTTFAALRSATRRRLVERLTHGPACVGELAKGLPVSGPAVSQHVKVLEEAGLVRREVRGQQRIVSLRPRALEDARRWLDRQRAFWEEQVDSLHEHLRKKRKRRRKVR